MTECAVRPCTVGNAVSFDNRFKGKVFKRPLKGLLKAFRRPLKDLQTAF